MYVPCPYFYCCWHVCFFAVLPISKPKAIFLEIDQTYSAYSHVSILEFPAKMRLETMQSVALSDRYRLTRVIIGLLYDIRYTLPDHSD